MADHGHDTDEATAVVRWLLEAGVRGLGLTNTHANEVERTTPDMPDAGVATAGVPLAELGLRVGQRIGYVFDFGDDWRVRLTVRERTAADAGDHPRVLEQRGTPPLQYAAIDD